MKKKKKQQQVDQVSRFVVHWQARLLGVAVSSELAGESHLDVGPPGGETSVPSCRRSSKKGGRGQRSKVSSAR